jgi:hypothetical protein
VCITRQADVYDFRILAEEAEIVVKDCVARVLDGRAYNSSKVTAHPEEPLALEIGAPAGPLMRLLTPRRNVAGWGGVMMAVQ